MKKSVRQATLADLKPGTIVLVGSKNASGLKIGKAVTGALGADQKLAVDMQSGERYRYYLDSVWIPSDYSGISL